MEQGQAFPKETKLEVFIHSPFNTNILIDTSSFDTHQLRKYADQTIFSLQQSYSEATWFQEDATAVHGADDPIDFLPVLNLSYVTASCPKLLTQNILTIEVSSGAICTVTFAVPIVHFHSFSTGVLSLAATLQWSRPCTQNDLQFVNDYLLKELAPLVEKQLADLTHTFEEVARRSKVPLYTLPFSNGVQASVGRKLLYWSHFIYVAYSPKDPDIEAAAEWLKPLMMPMDQQGISNMAIKPHRYIYLGNGRSIISCPTTFNDQIIRPYVRIVELRNFLWKTLYDLDRGMRHAIIQMRNIRSEQEAQKLTSSLRVLDFRVKMLFEELDGYKITLDHEKIWLIKQLDINWQTSELINSVQSRLQSFCDFYDYSEDTTRRKRDERLQAVLNLIGVLATAGTITSIVSYFDPSNRLAILERATFLVGSIVIAILVYYVTMLLIRQMRAKD